MVRGAGLLGRPKEIDRRMTISGEAVLMGRNAVQFDQLR
jgi:hypothetical protein